MTTQPLDEEELLVHNWHVARLTRPGVPRALAEDYADRLDWHQVARLIQHGCPRRWPCTSPADGRIRDEGPQARETIMSNHARCKSQAKVEQAQAELTEAEKKVAKEQAAAIARALHEDEAHRQADLHEVAVREAEAVPDRPPGP